MEVVKWDKQSAINGVSATVVLENRADLRDGEVFLVKLGEQVQCIELVDTWKGILNLPTADVNQVIEAYKQYRSEQDKAAQNVVNENEQLKKEIAALWYEVMNAKPGTGGEA